MLLSSLLKSSAKVALKTIRLLRSSQWNSGLVVSLSYFDKIIGNAESSEAANRKARVELAAAYRLLDKYGLNEGVCNHLTLMAPAASGQGQVMLLIPHGTAWSQVTASSLIALDDNNDVVEGEGEPELAAKTIHRPVHDARPDAAAVFHLHPPYSTSMSCLKDMRLRMVHQNSLRFWKNIAYDKKYQGFSTAFLEGARLAEILKEKEILMMANHGFLVASPTCSLAFDVSYYLERAAMFQMIAEATGRELLDLEMEAPELVKQTYETSVPAVQRYADAHFYGMMAALRKNEPEFEV